MDDFNVNIEKKRERAGPKRATQYSLLIYVNIIPLK